MSNRCMNCGWSPLAYWKSLCKKCWYANNKKGLPSDDFRVQNRSYQEREAWSRLPSHTRRFHRKNKTNRYNSYRSWR